jgi:hypothetical protein
MLVCSRCQHANPQEARFCHFDGVELRSAEGRADTAKLTRLPHEFVFPSGRRCYSYDDLARGCQEEWEVARGLLRQGVFRTFLASAGRMDLAEAAQETKGQSDPDLALDAFLSRLPASVDQGPQLDLNPRRIILGTLHVGDAKQIRLSIINQGKGLLRGTLAVAEGISWLKLGADKPNGECIIKTAREQQVTIRIDTRALTAPQKYSAKLTVITNGGIVEVPVRLDLAVHPFPKPPFQGVGTPREMAEKMRIQPKPAVPLLESGEVARWFAINGWTYPVIGPTAKGIAAVQQFFEGMGLSKPPNVQLVEPEIQIRCLYGETGHGELRLRTDAKKWVYARAESSASWLRLVDQNVSGPQQTVLAFDVDSDALEPNQQHRAQVSIVTNAAQKLTASVQVEVQKLAEPLRQRVFRPVVVGAVAAVLLRLFLAIPADLYARVLAAPAHSQPAAGSFGTWLQTPFATPGSVKHFVMVTWWVGAVLGGIVLWKRGRHLADALCGIMCGSMAGLVGSATLASLMPAADYPARALWGLVGAKAGISGTIGSVWLWSAAWIVLVSLSWAPLGVIFGAVLNSTGQAGTEFLARIGFYLSWLLRCCGLRRMADYFVWR